MCSLFGLWSDLVFMEVQAHFYKEESLLRTGVLRGKKIYSGVTASQGQRKSSLDSYRSKTKPLIKSFISVRELQTDIFTPLSIPPGFPDPPSPAPNLTLRL